MSSEQVLFINFFDLTIPEVAEYAGQLFGKDTVGKIATQQAHIKTALGRDDLREVYAAMMLGQLVQEGAIDQDSAAVLLAENFDNIGGHAAEQIMRKTMSLVKEKGLE